MHVQAEFKTAEKMSNQSILQAKNIVKHYGTKAQAIEAVRGVTFDVSPGELFGIIGLDGAGKTSLFLILTTLLLAD